MTSTHAAVDDLEIEPAFVYLFICFLARYRGHQRRAAYTAVDVTDGVASS